MSVGALASVEGNFRVGEAFRTALSVLWRNFLPFALLGAVPKLPWIVSELGDALPIVKETYDRLQAIGLSVGTEYVGLGDAALNVIELVLAAIAEAAIVCRAFHDMCAMRIGLVEAVRRGVSRLLPMLALVIGMEIGRILVFFLVAFRSYAFWYTAPLLLLPPSDGVLQLLTALLLSAPFIAPVWTLGTIWFVTTPACVLERLGIFQSLGRSRTLTQGYRWRLFGIFLLLFAVGWVMQKLASTIENNSINTAAWYMISALYFNTFCVVVRVAAYYHLRISAENEIERELGRHFE
jgi:hypothetical protein